LPDRIGGPFASGGGQRWRQEWAGATTRRVAEMPTLPPPQRTPSRYVSGGVEDGTVYVILKRPDLLRGAAGPNPSGGNSTADEVGMAGSSTGQACDPSVGMRPVMRTRSPGCTL